MRQLEFDQGEQRFCLRFLPRAQIGGGKIQGDDKSLPDRRTDSQPLASERTVRQFGLVCKVAGDDAFIIARSEIRGG